MIILACNTSPIYELGFTFENQQWSNEDIKSFSFTAPDTVSQFDLILDLEHSVDYRYENLYVELETIFPDKEAVTDQISIPLINKDGEWVGRGNTVKHLRVYLQQALRFKQAGDHTIHIRQYSREQSLTGLHTISLAIFAAT